MYDAADASARATVAEKRARCGFLDRGVSNASFAADETTARGGANDNGACCFPKGGRVVLRVALITGFALATMGVIANGTLLQRVGVNAGCSVTRSTGALQLESCHKGWFKGFPNLSARGCTSVSVTANRQYWSCPLG
jgi:hypothetical protein